MRPPYTIPFMGWQNVPAGDTVDCQIVAPVPACVVRIDFVSMYWGAPSSVASNSCVLLPNGAASGYPTIVSYDSGVTGSSNPIYEEFHPRVVLPPVAASDENFNLFVFVNTSFSESVDVYASGILLMGSPPVDFFSELS